MSRVSFVVVALSMVAVSALVTRGSESVSQSPPVLAARDAGGRGIEAIQAGSTLHVVADGLAPRRTYEFRLGVDRPAPTAAEAVSFARVSADGNGQIAPFILWYHTGVVGCSLGDSTAELAPFMFRSFDSAEQALAGLQLHVTVHEVEIDPTGRRRPADLAVGDAIDLLLLPVANATDPVIYPSDGAGCLLNSAAVRERDMFVSGRNFAPHQEIVLSVVENQRLWSVGDPVIDLTGEAGTREPVTIQADELGRFTANVWEAARQRRGVYDLVAQPKLPVADLVAVRSPDLLAIRAQDIASYAADTGYVIYSLASTSAIPTMDLAGRPVSGRPYFQFADSFAHEGDVVWGAVDPTDRPEGHSGGRYAAYYVVEHRDPDGWDPAAGGSLELVDVSGGIEIQPIKPGCINGTIIPIWHGPLSLGEYDVVVDFGATPAETKPDYQTDLQYNATVDFLDGAVEAGFIVAPDPHDDGPHFAGEYEYDAVDFFPVLDEVSDIDLRAVVRYPAVEAGAGTAVAPGQHPIFFILHGTHAYCDVQRDGTPYYEALRKYHEDVEALGCDPDTEACKNAKRALREAFDANKYGHSDCPEDQRTENHKGYMGLLETLATHGIIAVSLDGYDVTLVENKKLKTMSARATLILKHMEFWAHLDDPSVFTDYARVFTEFGNPPTDRFKGHVDMSRISVSGHSKAGEAAVVAYLLNSSSANPFSIGSVSSIAPTDLQKRTLPDVPYFVILPAADGDQGDLRGMRIYDRAGRSVSTGVDPDGALLPGITVDSTTKSGIHVYGANHNFFNSVWAQNLDDSWVPRQDQIGSAEQQVLGESYLAAFARIHLKDEVVYEDMFRGRLVFPSTAGFKIYHFRHEAEHDRVESGAGAASADSTAEFTSQADPSVHSTRALAVTWSSGGNELIYRFSAPRKVSAHEVLSFRAAQFTTDPTTNPINGGTDFTVELIGGGPCVIGGAATPCAMATYAARFDAIPEPYNRETDVNGAPTGETDNYVMTTVRIPLRAFTVNNSGVDLDGIEEVRFRFDVLSEGQVYVDDIEFGR